ncbi:hypothetical protein JEY40_31715 [Bradyrhizobium japonicum]|uniref:hypothetical protein n=1 Tax=Bradyrhizobium japonicum TaxID=375 RepID=UPI00200BC9ED|nr:hypothetical protein [Bradyrhizobium japonicum]UQD70492.1 hypothetical protein JEY40_31715 [Bradyrhizobium japonicum]
MRDRAWHFIDADIAASAGLTLAQLQQFVAGSFTPTQEQLEQLARRIGVQR